MIPFLAVALTIMIGFAGLAADTGMIWVTRANLQNSVDAAVLAAASELPAPDPLTKDAIRTVACEYSAQRNPVRDMFGTTGDCSGKSDVTFPDSTTIRVKAYRTVQPVFGQVLGAPAVDVSAEASAKIGSLGSACLFPVFLTTAQITNTTAFFVPVKFVDASAAINVGSGSSAVRAAMRDSTCGDAGATSFSGVTGDPVPIKTGSATQFQDGWQDIKTAATQPGSTCPSPEITAYTSLDAAGRVELSPTVTVENCSRLVIVPVLNAASGSSGTIQGFIPFYFADICTNSAGCSVPGITGLVENHKAWGYYVRMDVTSPTYTDYDPKFGTKVVVLSG